MSIPKKLIFIFFISLHISMISSLVRATDKNINIFIEVSSSHEKLRNEILGYATRDLQAMHNVKIVDKLIDGDWVVDIQSLYNEGIVTVSMTAVERAKTKRFKNNPNPTLNNLSSIAFFYFPYTRLFTVGLYRLQAACVGCILDFEKDCLEEYKRRMAKQK